MVDEVYPANRASPVGSPLGRWGSLVEKETAIRKKDARIKDINHTGNYGIRLNFDDGHDTGIFVWEYLHDLAKTKRNIGENTQRNSKRKTSQGC